MSLFAIADKGLKSLDSVEGGLNGLGSVARGLNSLDYVVVATYLLAMLGMGIYFSRRQTSGEEYFVGARRLPAFAVGLSLMATLMSTITFLASPGEMIQHGAAFATATLSTIFWLPIVALVWVPFFMRYRLTSIYEYAAMRFGTSTRLLTAGLFICMRFGWMGMVIYTASDAVATMTANLPRGMLGRDLTPVDMRNWLLLLIAALGIVATAYTFLGGIRAVVWTDVIQALVMGGGALFVVGYVWNSTGEGPIEWWQRASQHQRAAPIWFRLDHTVERTVFLVLLNAFFWRICTHCSDQVATQRYFTTDGPRSAVRSNVVGAIGDIVIQILLGMVGLGLLVFFAGNIDPDSAHDAKEAFPSFILNHMPHGLAGMLMASLFAAAMSSIDSGINSISAVVTVDFYRLRNSRTTEQNEMRVARNTTIVSGIAVTLVAMFIASVITADPENRNIVDLSIRVFNVFLGPLGAVFMAGMLMPWVGTAAVNLSLGVGVPFALLLAFYKELGLQSPPSALLVTPLSALVTLLLAAALGAILRSPQKSQIQGHTWWTRHEAFKNSANSAT